MFLKSSLQTVNSLRTKRQQVTVHKGSAMLTDLKAAVARSSDTFLQAAVGLVSLIAMLVIGLNLPDLI